MWSMAPTVCSHAGARVLCRRTLLFTARPLATSTTTTTTTATSMISAVRRLSSTLPVLFSPCSVGQRAPLHTLIRHRGIPAGANRALSSSPSSSLCSFSRSALTTLFLRQQRHGSSSSSSSSSASTKATSTALYLASTVVLCVGAAYASVPLYKMFCQATGFGGTTGRVEDVDKIRGMEPVEGRRIKIKFSASTSATMRWKFFPQQKEVTLVPGETALAFFTAINPTDDAITGMSTYNVVPFEAGQYFNKIQCFCFEEQRLNPHEEVDMPVFFYIDPEFADDPQMERVDEITLSYTFFKSKDMNTSLPRPASAPAPAQAASSPLASTAS